MVKSAILPAAALVPLATAALYPGVTTDNHTCILSTLRRRQFDKKNLNATSQEHGLTISF